MFKTFANMESYFWYLERLGGGMEGPPSPLRFKSVKIVERSQTVFCKHTFFSKNSLISRHANRLAGQFGW